MKNFRNRVLAIAIGVVLGFSGIVLAATFTKFSPATGILKGSSSTYVTTAASASDLLTVIGTVPVANGGTNLTTATDDNTIIGNGTTWQSKAIPSCANDGSHAIVYDTSTNTFACSTLTGGTASSGTFTATYTTGFTASQTQDYQWYKVGQIVTIKATSQMSGTSNATTLTTATAAAPAAIRPTTNGTIPQIGVAIQDAGTGKQGCLKIDSDGTMSYGIYAVAGNICGFNTWTATGTKLIAAGTNGVGQTFGTYGSN